jgi:hypothetical protein
LLFSDDEEEEEEEEDGTSFRLFLQQFLLADGRPIIT